MPTAKDIYADTVKQLPALERLRLVRLIIDDLTPDEPTVTATAGQQRFEELVQEALDSGPATPMTKQDWNDIRQEVRLRAERRNGNLHA